MEQRLGHLKKAEKIKDSKIMFLGKSLDLPLLNSPDITQTGSSRLRWTGHIIRREEGKIGKEIWRNPTGDPVEDPRNDGRTKERESPRESLVIGVEEYVMQRMLWRHLVDETKFN
ncbi:hypothetical protein J6590_054091 [Homalodisca vitripennis]|nr:hypothetical protein J6590_054091 [Homalodisca vitripennis]